MGKSYKVRRKIIKTQAYSDYLEAKRRETMSETLERIGYRQEKEYTDCCSHLAW